MTHDAPKKQSWPVAERGTRTSAKAQTRAPWVCALEGTLGGVFEQMWRDRNAARGFTGILDQVAFESFMLLKLRMKLSGRRLTTARARWIAWDIARDAMAEFLTERYMAEHAAAIQARMVP